MPSKLNYQPRRYDFPTELFTTWHWLIIPLGFSYTLRQIFFVKIVLAVALGSALGGILRYLISTWVDSKLDHPLPWGTVMVNVIGCLLIGLAAELTNAHGKWAMEAYWRSFLLLGILGGFTTFSSFSHQTLELFHLGEFLHASLNVILSVCLCLFSVYLGHLLGNHLNRII